MGNTKDISNNKLSNKQYDAFSFYVFKSSNTIFKTLIAILFSAIIATLIFHEEIIPTPGVLTSPEIKQQSDTGLGGVEFGHGNYWRWAFGPETRVSFATSTDKDMVLTYSFNSPIEGQGMTIYANNVLLRRYDSLPASFFGENIIYDKLKFHAAAGDNTLRITYDDWNGYKSHTISGEEKYAICFYRLYLSN